MALIKCINCGHMISDKAVKCPKCGTPIQMIKEAAKPIEKEEKVIAEVETPKAEIAKAEAVVPDEPKSQTWKKVCGIFIFAVIVFVGVYYYIQNEKSNSKSEEEIAQLNSEAFLEDGEYCYKGKWESAQHAAQPCKVEFIIKNGALIDCAYTNLKFNVRIPLKGTIEDNNLHFVSENDGKLIIELKVCDNGMMLIGEGTDYAHSGNKARLNLSKIELDGEKNEQIAVPLNKNAKDNICNAYLEALHNLGVSDDMSYFLFDITNDGIPDLWVTEGNSTICDLTVFSYQVDRCNVIYAGGASHSTFYAGSNYILLWWGHQGNQAWIKLTYDGNTINSSVIFEGVVVDESDWKEPKEKKIEFYQAYNEQPIKRAFGME